MQVQEFDLEGRGNLKALHTFSWGSKVTQPGPQSCYTRAKSVSPCPESTKGQNKKKGQVGCVLPACLSRSPSGCPLKRPHLTHLRSLKAKVVTLLKLLSPPGVLRRGPVADREKSLAEWVSASFERVLFEAAATPRDQSQQWTQGWEKADCRFHIL